MLSEGNAIIRCLNNSWIELLLVLFPTLYGDFFSADVQLS